MRSAGDPRPVEHFRPYLICYAYRLETPQGVFVYSGDTGPTAAMRTLAKGADVPVCHYVTDTQLNEGFAESCMGHKELAALARDCKVKTLVTTHITEQFDKPGMR